MPVEFLIGEGKGKSGKVGVIVGRLGKSGKVGLKMGK